MIALDQGGGGYPSNPLNIPKMKPTSLMTSTRDSEIFSRNFHSKPDHAHGGDMPSQPTLTAGATLLHFPNIREVGLTLPQSLLTFWHCPPK